MAYAKGSGVYELFQLAQIAILLVLYWVALGLFVALYPSGTWINFDLYLTVCVLLVLTLAFTSFVTNEEKTNMMFPNLQMALQVSLKRTLAVLFTLLLYLVATKNGDLSRFFLFTLLPFLYVALFLTHRYLPQWMIRISFRARRIQATVLCGSVSRTVTLRHWFVRKSKLGLNVVGLLTDTEGVQVVEDIPVLGRIADLERILAAGTVSQVILLHVPEPRSDLIRFYELCERRGVRLLVINDLDDILGHAMVLMEDDGLTFIGVRNEPLENVLNRALKRMLDIAIASLVIVLVLPWAALLVKICQWLQSPGPLFYTQQRSGLQNQAFRLIKFRTMHIHQEPAANQATRGDRRIFPTGAFLRRFSIDELPQFWNVLRGEMSTVGPRPHLPEHNELFSRVMGNYYVRSVVKPGLTGLAQVRGFRGQADTEEKLRARIVSDLYYVENWSLAMDLIIILRTGAVMIVPPETAY